MLCLQKREIEEIITIMKTIREKITNLIINTKILNMMITITLMMKSGDDFPSINDFSANNHKNNGLK